MGVAPLADGGYTPRAQQQQDPEPVKEEPKDVDPKPDKFPPDKVVERIGPDGKKYYVIEHTVRPGENVWTRVHANGTPTSMEEFYALNPKVDPR